MLADASMGSSPISFLSQSTNVILTAVIIKITISKFSPCVYWCRGFGGHFSFSLLRFKNSVHTQDENKTLHNNANIDTSDMRNSNFSEGQAKFEHCGTLIEYTFC
jgi:hypothetical protein